MAEKAVASSSKTQPGLTFSQATANAVATPSPFAHTECDISLEKHLPTIRLPKLAGLYPVFFDLRSTTASSEDILNALPVSLLGCVFREDKHIVEMDCMTADEQTALLAHPLTIPGHTPLTPIPPQSTIPRYTLVKLSNVPVRTVTVLETLIRNQFKSHGEIVEIGPHRIATRQWITRRWDLVIKTPADEPLEAPTLFELFGEKVHAWWIRSPKTCLTCKVVGHLSSSPICPRRKKKSSSGHPTAVTAESGVSSDSVTAAPLTTSQRKSRKRQQARQARKAAADPAVPSGNFTLSVPLPSSSTNTDDSRSYIPSFTTSILGSSSTATGMDMDSTSSPPTRPPPSCPFAYNPEQRTALKKMSDEEMANYCESLRLPYADNTDPFYRDFLDLPPTEMARLLRISLAIDYNPASPRPRSRPTTRSVSSARTPPTPSSRRVDKRSK